MELLSYMMGYNKGCEDGGGGAPDTGVVSILIRGPLTFGSKISDYVPPEDTPIPISVFILTPFDNDEAGLWGPESKLEPIELGGNTGLLIKEYEEAIFIILPKDIPEEGLTRGIYYYANKDVNESFVGILMFVDFSRFVP